MFLAVVIYCFPSFFARIIAYALAISDRIFQSKCPINGYLSGQMITVSRSRAFVFTQARNKKIFRVDYADDRPLISDKNRSDFARDLGHIVKYESM